MLPTWPPSASADMRILDPHAGLVESVPRRKRVAILGFGSSSRHLAPWNDPAVELWTLNQSFHVAERRPDRTFEIHRGEARVDAAEPDYLDDLRALAIPLYMIDHEPEFPSSVRYPLDAIQAGVPTLYHGYFTCCVAYMIALALHEGFEWIGLYGVDSTIGTEYEAQKPCIEAWLSLAIGRGVEAYVPQTSALFKTPFLYGYQEPKQWPRVLQASEQFLLERIDEHKARCNEGLEMVHRLQGAIEELAGLRSLPQTPEMDAELVARITSCEVKRAEWLETRARHEGAAIELTELLKFAISSARGSVFPVLDGGTAAEKAHAAHERD